MLTKSDVISPVFEKQLSFMMQNFMEARSYRQVAAREQPDLVVTPAAAHASSTSHNEVTPANSSTWPV